MTFENYGGDPILTAPLSSLKTIDVSHAPPRHFRFLDCRAFTESQILHILSFPSLPSTYTCLSYTWRGLPSDSMSPTMTIRGATNGDNPNISVLHTICLASQHFSIPLLWFDMLCIQQSSDYDKSWQIQNMASLYSNCSLCLISAGGISRLCSPFEETNWLHRMWTLQEAILPKKVHCLFSWEYGNTTVKGIIYSKIEEIEPGKSAIWNLYGALVSGIRNEILVEARKGEPARFLGGCGASGKSQMVALEAAMNASWRVSQPSHIGPAYGAFWRCIWMRTATKPIDMVWASMGLFGVSLDPSKFSEDDLPGAMTALLREIMKGDGVGGTAIWLGAAPQLRPQPGITIIPVFPNDMNGKATVDGKEVGEHLDQACWWVKDAVRGSIDDDGWFSFEGQYSQVVKVDSDEKDDTVAALYGGDKWRIAAEPEVTTSGELSTMTRAVAVGRYQQFLSGYLGCYVKGADVLLMIVRRLDGGDENRWERLNFAWIEPALLVSWPTGKFSVR